MLKLESKLSENNIPCPHGLGYGLDVRIRVKICARDRYADLLVLPFLHNATPLHKNKPDFCAIKRAVNWFNNTAKRLVMLDDLVKYFDELAQARFESLYEKSVYHHFITVSRAELERIINEKKVQERISHKDKDKDNILSFGSLDIHFSDIDRCTFDTENNCTFNTEDDCKS